MKKITVLDIKFYPHTVRWYRRKKSKQDSTQVSCYDGFAHIETVDGMRTAHVRVICDPTEKPDKVCTIHMARAYDIRLLVAVKQDPQMVTCVGFEQIILSHGIRSLSMMIPQSSMPCCFQYRRDNSNRSATDGRLRCERKTASRTAILPAAK